LTDNYTLNIRWDYLLHAMVYFPLPLLMVLGWKRNLRMVWIVAVSLAVFVLFELIQRILPYRSFNINDMVANGVGVMLGWTGVLIFRKRLKLKEV
jgi:VanZ family protein